MPTDPISERPRRYSRSVTSGAGSSFTAAQSHPVLLEKKNKSSDATDSHWTETAAKHSNQALHQIACQDI